VEENEKACYEIIERVKTQPVDDETLRRVKTKVRADLIERMDSNSGMADELASYYGSYGDWRELFRSIQEIEKVSAADVQRVAQKYLVPERRTEVYTSPPQGAASKPGAGGQQ
jgi:predicted Zn-dependent peptidase